MASVARSSSILAEGSGAFLRAVTEMPIWAASCGPRVNVLYRAFCAATRDRRAPGRSELLAPSVGSQDLQFDQLRVRGRVAAQWRRAVTIQARELNQTPSSRVCAASASRSRPTARAAAAGSNRFSTSLVQVKPPTQSRAAATSGP